MRWLKRILVVVLILLALPYALTLAYVVVDPPSTLILMRRLRGESVDQRWVPLSQISPSLVRSVVTSEDAGFCRHFGVDFGAIRDALRQAEERDAAARGASTITMQVAKNLFLFNDRSWVPQGAGSAARALDRPHLVEAARARGLSRHRRMGPGVFGAEAAARTHVRCRGIAAQRAPVDLARDRAARSGPALGGAPAAAPAPPRRPARGTRDARDRRFVLRRLVEGAALLAEASRAPASPSSGARSCGNSQSEQGGGGARGDSAIGRVLDSIAPAAPGLVRGAFSFGDRHGRSQEKDFAVAARHAPQPRQLAAPTYVEDKDSGELRRPHHLDLKTGMYRGRQVLKVEAGRLTASAACRKRPAPCAGLLFSQLTRRSVMVRAGSRQRRYPRMSILKAFPFTIVPVLIYTAVALIGGTGPFDSAIFSARMPSGAVFSFTNGIAILTLALVMLLLEVLKSTNVKNSNSIIDHGLSTVLLVVTILMFVLLPSAATGTFFGLVMICLIDVIAGFSVSIKTAQRDFQVDRSFN